MSPPTDARKFRAQDRLTWPLVIIVLLVTADAEAYIDPGSGSLLLQILLAGLAAGAFVVREKLGHLVARVRGWFGRRPDDDTTTPPE